MPRDYKLEKPQPPAEKLTDLSPMPFGKHRNTLLQDVPPSYLLWLWDEGGIWQEPQKPIHHYIKESFNALLKDCPDYLPVHRP